MCQVFVVLMWYFVIANISVHLHNAIVLGSVCSVLRTLAVWNGWIVLCRQYLEIAQAKWTYRGCSFVVFDLFSSKVERSHVMTDWFKSYLFTSNKRNSTVESKKQEVSVYTVRQPKRMAGCFPWYGRALHSVAYTIVAHVEAYACISVCACAKTTMWTNGIQYTEWERKQAPIKAFRSVKRQFIFQMKLVEQTQYRYLFVQAYTNIQKIQRKIAGN